MANNTIDIKEDASPTKKLASQSFTRGVDTVHQEEVTIGDGSTDGRVVAVTAANALKIDGSAVNQPVTDAGGSLTVDALDLDIRNLATGQDKVDARVRNAADSAFVEPSTLGEQQTQTTALQLLDDVVITDNTAFTDGTTKLEMSGYIFDETAGTALTENDAAAARVDSKRAQVQVIEDETTRGRRLTVTADKAALIEGRRGQTLLFASVSAAASGDNAIVAADASNKIKVLSYVIVADAAVSAKWRSATTDLTGAMALAAGGGVAVGGGNSPTTHWEFETAVNQALNLNLNAAIGVRGHICYFKEP